MLYAQCIESQMSLEEQMESSHQRKMEALNTALQDVMDGMKQLAPSGGQNSEHGCGGIRLESLDLKLYCLTGVSFVVV